jgi:hypothetical protein
MCISSWTTLALTKQRGFGPGLPSGHAFPCTLRPPTDRGSNLVERWFAELTNKRIRRGVFRSVKELEAAIPRVHRRAQRKSRTFVWTRTADQILDSIARLAQRALASQPDRLIPRTIGTGDRHSGHLASASRSPCANRAGGFTDNQFCWQ